MKDRNKKLFSVENEVALHPDQNRERPQAENLPEPREKTANSESCYYSSTAFEPGVGNGVSVKYRELFQQEQDRYPDSVLPFISILAGVAGGVFAVPAVILNEIAGAFSAVSLLSAGAFVLVVLGPFAEETLKLIPESKSKLVSRPLPADDPKRRRPDISLAKELLGWEPKVPLAEGLAKTIEYFRAREKSAAGR